MIVTVQYIVLNKLISILKKQVSTFILPSIIFQITVFIMSQFKLYYYLISHFNGVQNNFLFNTV